MRRPILATAMAALVIGWLPAASWVEAQGGPRWTGSGGWGPGAPYMRSYDPSRVVTVKGTVASIGYVTPLKGMARGIHLTLKTEAETLDVHLGPSWFLENQDVKLAPNDVIEVTGSRVTIGGRAALIAAEVKKGDAVLRLRDAGGFPAWSAIGRR